MASLLRVDEYEASCVVNHGAFPVWRKIAVANMVASKSSSGTESMKTASVNGLTTDFSLIGQMDAAQHGLWNAVVELWAWAMKQEISLIRQAIHPGYCGWVIGHPAVQNYETGVLSVGPDSPRVIRCCLQPVGVAVFDHCAGVAHYCYEAQVQMPDSSSGSSSQICGRWSEFYMQQSGKWLMVSVSGGPDGQRQ